MANIFEKMFEKPPKIIEAAPPTMEFTDLQSQINKALKSMLTFDRLNDILVGISLKEAPPKNAADFVTAVSDDLAYRLSKVKLLAINIAVDAHVGSASEVDTQKGELYDVLTDWLGDELVEVIEAQLHNTNLLDMEVPISTETIKEDAFLAAISEIVAKFFSKIEVAPSPKHDLVRKLLKKPPLNGNKTQ